jgi:hypothetical protein
VGSMPCLVVTLGPRGLESMPLLQCRAGVCALSSLVDVAVGPIESIWAGYYFFVESQDGAQPTLP